MKLLLQALNRMIHHPQGQRWILYGLLLLSIIGLFVYIQRAGDFRGYIRVGNLVLEGHDIYTTKLNTWPPFFSLVCVPLALLAAPTHYLARGFWIILNYIFLILVLRFISKLVYKQEFSLSPKPDKLSLASKELLIPILLTYLYISENFAHLQINILLFLLVLAGLYFQSTHRELLGGIAIGWAVAMKVMPVIFIPYFIYRRRFKLALYSTLVTILLSLSPILIFGWEIFWKYMNTWWTTIKTGWGVGKMNQSIFAMLDRYVGHEIIPILTKGANGVPASDKHVVFILWIASIAIFSVMVLFIFRGNLPQGSKIVNAEWSVVLIFSVLFGTVCWKAYLVVLLLPNALLFKTWISPHVDLKTRKIVGIFLFLPSIMAGMNSRELIGKNLSG